jgi:hypothetical protein
MNGRKRKIINGRHKRWSGQNADSQGELNAVSHFISD